MAMTSDHKQVAVDMAPFFRLFSDGTIDRLSPSVVVPASEDPSFSVRSKDVIIEPETSVSVRIFAPRPDDPPQKLPVVVYIHGGAFCMGSPAATVFHNFIATVVEQANVIAVSIDYRLAPENPLPTAYDDSWTAFQWITAHADGNGSDSWLNELADFKRLFIGGESAGANIATDVALRSGDRVELAGLFLMHPFFGGKEEDKLYKFLCPSSTARDDDPRLNPAVDPRIGKMSVRRVIFFVAENDFLAANARNYYEGLKKSDWRGEADMVETKGEGHCFYLFSPNSEKALAVMARLVAFFKTPQLL